MHDVPPLLLVHGFPLDAGMWAPQVAGLAGLTEVIAEDLRGFGRDTRELPAIMPMRSHAADIKELIDARGIGKVVMCGLSMGGYITMAFAERWPERLAGIILCNTRSSADDEDGVAARHDMARNARGKGMEVIARGMIPNLLGPATRSERPDVAELVTDIIARQRPETVAATALGMAQRPDRLAVLQRLKVPALIITGDHDVLMPIPTSQVMADAMPGSRLAVLPGAGHLTNLEVPGLFNRTVQLFFEEHFKGS
jgi:3-oxoadipate enol-lactonase